MPYDSNLNLQIQTADSDVTNLSSIDFNVLTATGELIDTFVVAVQKKYTPYSPTKYFIITNIAEITWYNEFIEALRNYSLANCCSFIFDADSSADVCESNVKILNRFYLCSRPTTPSNVKYNCIALCDRSCMTEATVFTLFRIYNTTDINELASRMQNDIDEGYDMLAISEDSSVHVFYSYINTGFNTPVMYVHNLQNSYFSASDIGAFITDAINGFLQLDNHRYTKDLYDDNTIIAIHSTYSAMENTQVQLVSNRIEI